MNKLFVQVERAEDLIDRVDDYFSKPKQKQNRTTNGDRIRAMSDEELADYLRYYSDSYARYDMDWLDWLKQKGE